MQPPFNWAINHLHWPFIVAAAWWLRGYLNVVKEKFCEIHLAVTNHLGHEIVSAVRDEGEKTRECIRDNRRAG